MTPKIGERVFEKTYSYTLIEIAKEDLFAASTLAKNSRTRKETALFLSQQGIKKSLKAVLCHLRIPVPLIHDLGALVAKMPEKVNPPYGYDLTRFNDYAGILRYEKGSEKISSKEVLAALKIGKEVHAWASALMKS